MIPTIGIVPRKDGAGSKNLERAENSPDLPKQRQEKLLPVYERLSNEQLLERCSRVSTLNANESLNEVIWWRCPIRSGLARSQ